MRRINCFRGSLCGLGGGADKQILFHSAAWCTDILGACLWLWDALLIITSKYSISTKVALCLQQFLWSFGHFWSSSQWYASAASNTNYAVVVWCCRLVSNTPGLLSWHIKCVCVCMFIKIEESVLFGAHWRNFGNIFSNASTICSCSTELINSHFWGWGLQWWISYFVSTYITLYPRQIILKIMNNS